ncbi:MAG: trehalose-phosphatase [Erythrobacter sp.]
MDSSLDSRPPPPLASMLQGGPVALFLDFDGTLVDLAPGPDAIEPVADLGQRLRALAERLEGRCALISGRAIVDIERHLGELPTAAAGSHGSDRRDATGESLGPGPTGLPLAIESRLRKFAGQNDLEYEHKPHGGALHYRRNPEMGERAVVFARDLAGECGWAVQEGKCVIELVAEQAGKGEAVLAFMNEAPFVGARPFFLGDDLTDEAGFKMCEGLGGAGVLVGEREGTCARYRLSDVEAVHEWLGL